MTDVDHSRREIGTSIRVAMARRKCSTRDLAQAVGISPSLLSRKLAGRTVLWVEELTRICAALKVTPGEILAPAPPPFRLGPDEADSAAGDPADSLDTAGLRVVWVNDLGTEGVLVAGHELLVLDAAVTDERMKSLVGQAIEKRGQLAPPRARRGGEGATVADLARVAQALGTRPSDLLAAGLSAE